MVMEIQDRCDQYDATSAKRMTILSGFYGSTKKHECLQQVHEFVYKEIGIVINIEDVFFIGSATPREIVIILQSVTEKKNLYQHKSKLKDIVNKDGKPYFFRDYRPPTANDTNRRCAEITKQMQTMDDVEQKEITIQGRSIYIGQEEYKKKILPPNATTVLLQPIEELNRVLSIQVQDGARMAHKENYFTGYTIAAADAGMIKDAYMKLRLNHAEARHIVCAWNIPGLNRFECEDYADDQDLGMGSVLLKQLQDNNITHRAIFVVRKCGQKLNQDRAECYRQVAVKTLQINPANSVLKTQQQIPALEPPVSAPSTDRPTYSAPLEKMLSSMNCISFAEAVKKKYEQPRNTTTARGRAYYRPGRARGNRGRGRMVPNNERRVYNPKPVTSTKTNEERDDVE